MARHAHDMRRMNDVTPSDFPARGSAPAYADRPPRPYMQMSRVEFFQPRSVFPLYVIDQVDFAGTR